MSHFVVYVFTKENNKDVKELLAPYDEGIIYAPYIKYTKEQLIAKIRKDIEEFNERVYKEFLADPEEYKANYTNQAHIDYIENEFPKKLNWSDEECYQEGIKWYNEDELDEEGNVYSTYNVNSKWDWYQIGGRWDESLVKKNGERCNECYVNEVDWEKTYVPFAFITPNGIWYERDEMGWWCVVDNEKEENKWEEEFKKAVEKLGDNVMVTLVDCHI